MGKLSDGFARYIESTDAAIIFLSARYPKAFDRPKPLMVGIYHEIVEDDVLMKYVDEKLLKTTMRRWTSKFSYLTQLTLGAPRYDLFGHEAGSVTEGEASWARCILKRDRYKTKMKQLQTELEPEAVS